MLVCAKQEVRIVYQRVIESVNSWLLKKTRQLKFCKTALYLKK
ncbi:hypothetical protein SAMN05660206_101188 [Sphingobacterium wenxiniae]|uniref:Uncharacterized protein n=1 Tax=Sphingobacterium wenxiniae TaxID=683125 RepID=A0A1I6NZ18_9SPHI|nr:hypothetical protein SAMN05660206_101188 [Sphingobacterium wenxiniae]